MGLKEETYCNRVREQRARVSCLETSLKLIRSELVFYTSENSNRILLDCVRCRDPCIGMYYMAYVRGSNKAGLDLRVTHCRPDARIVSACFFYMH